MENNDVTRRNFLRGFAALSSTVLLMGITSGCGSDGAGITPVYGPKAVYGPPPVPVGTTVVTGMYYLDSSANRVDLHNSASVPVSPRFQVTMSAPFQLTYSAGQNPATLSFALTQGSSVVECTLQWVDTRTAEIVPKSELQRNTSYTLQVSNGTDSSGNSLAKGDAATFTTAA